MSVILMGWLFSVLPNGHYEDMRAVSDLTKRQCAALLSNDATNSKLLHKNDSTARCLSPMGYWFATWDEVFNSAEE